MGKISESDDEDGRNSSAKKLEVLLEKFQRTKFLISKSLGPCQANFENSTKYLLFSY